ncbi:hypothetical protein R1flu_017834 [Riccia fluitans]|uniref:Uncharacterized protein n=1 Tax=Riccia fluitans TaxID=41844 RepID=A0ABD1ZFF5_9MARC
MPRSDSFLVRSAQKARSGCHAVHAPSICFENALLGPVCPAGSNASVAQWRPKAQPQDMEKSHAIYQQVLAQRLCKVSGGKEL